MAAASPTTSPAKARPGTNNLAGYSPLNLLTRSKHNYATISLLRGLDADEADAHFAFLGALTSDEWLVREVALKRLGEVDLHEKAAYMWMLQNISAVQAMLEDPDWLVRATAAKTLGRMLRALESTDRHNLAASISKTTLKHPDWGVRHAALNTLAELEPDDLGSYTAQLILRVRDPYEHDWVKKAAGSALDILPDMVKQEAMRRLSMQRRLTMLLLLLGAERE